MAPRQTTSAKPTKTTPLTSFSAGWPDLLPTLLTIVTVAGVWNTVSTLAWGCGELPTRTAGTSGAAAPTRISRTVTTATCQGWPTPDRVKQPKVRPMTHENQPPQQPAQPYGQQQPYQQAVPGQPYPPQAYYAPPPPQKQSHTLRNVLLVIGVLMLLGIGGCVAITAAFVNEVDNAIDESIESDKIPGRRDNPLTIEEGEGFEVDGFDYAAGWSVGKDFVGDIEIKGLKVTNNRDDRDSALVEIKFWKGDEILGLADCTTEPIDLETTTKLGCISVDKLPKTYDKITINDSF
jgi:hypothetical protein